MDIRHPKRLRANSHCFQVRAILPVSLGGTVLHLPQLPIPKRKRNSDFTELDFSGQEIPILLGRARVGGALCHLLAPNSMWFSYWGPSITYWPLILCLNCSLENSPQQYILNRLFICVFHRLCHCSFRSSASGHGFPGGSDDKESPCSAGDLGSIPGLGRSPLGGSANPLQYSCLENPHGQGSLVGYSPWGHKESGRTK